MVVCEGDYGRGRMAGGDLSGFGWVNACGPECTECVLKVEEK